MNFHDTRFLKLATYGLTLANTVTAATVLDSVTGRGNEAGVPETYGSNLPGTPDIALHWGTGSKIDGWDSYPNWDGRGEVIQTDFGQSNPMSVKFTPSGPTIGVWITSFDLDEWTGGGASEINWAIKNGASTIVSGTWDDFVVADGGRSNVATGMTEAQALANLGDPLTLELALGGGTTSYLALDNLAFDQVVGTPSPRVRPEQASYDTGSDITVNFSGGPGNPDDRIGIYDSGVIPGNSNSPLLWLYTNGTQSAGGSATSGNVTFTNPGLAADTYQLWFLASGGNTVIAGPTDLVVTPPTGLPKWVTSPFRRRHGVVDTAYTGKISAYASDPDGGALTFTKIAGPSWLTLSPNGALGGTPGAGDVGTNTFTIRATEPGTLAADATMTIEVQPAGAEEVTSLKVLSYNLWHGWAIINNGRRKGIESIILSDADLIGTQETVANSGGDGSYQVQKIAEELGWFYGPSASGDSGIASRYPITATMTAGVAKGAKVQVTSSPLREVIIYNCHLDYVYYGPYAAQLSGATAASVLTEELRSQRDEQIADIMSAIAPDLAAADTTPVFLTGDFNAPSHLDWTPATAASHGGVSGVAWPASTAVHNGGMSDSFRDIHPDPAATPGITWSPLFVGDPADRIDFVYYKSNALTPVASSVFHTPIEVTLGAWGGNTTPAANNTWPSDHAAVLSTFHLDFVDSDHDGLSDAFEMKHFGNLTSQSGADDADSDSHTNLAEQMTGSSPVDPNSTPGFSSQVPATPGDPVEISFGLSPLALGPGLVCERSTDLDLWTTVWSFRADPQLLSPLITPTDAGGGWMIKIADPAIVPGPQPLGFHRLRPGD